MLSHTHLIILSYQAQTHYLTQCTTTKWPDLEGIEWQDGVIILAHKACIITFKFNQFECVCSKHILMGLVNTLEKKCMTVWWGGSKF